MTQKTQGKPIITADDVKRFVSESSSFTFEMKIAKIFSDLKYSVNHNGYYDDPITKKFREFDIQATYSYNDEGTNLHLAVECKKLDPSFPLVIHRVKRNKKRAYHFLIRSPFESEIENLPDKSFTHYPFESLIKIEDTISSYGISPYAYKSWVGASMDQISIDTNGKIRANDSETFDKMSQAISSSYSLIESVFSKISAKTGHRRYHCVVPILVVPDNTLWACDYDENGTLIQEPKVVNHIQQYIGRSWEFDSMDFHSYEVSHIEIITESYIKSFHSSMCLGEDGSDGYFDRQAINAGETKIGNE